MVSDKRFAIGRLDHPAAAFVEPGEFRHRHCQAHPLGLAGGKMHAGEGLQFARRPLDGGAVDGNIKLDDVVAGLAAGIGDVDRRFQCRLRRQRVAGCLLYTSPSPRD